jgi:ribose 5-phosphate isomerase B
MLYIVADHAGFILKNQILELCTKHNVTIIDLYQKYDKNDDYPNVAIILADQLKQGGEDDLGIAVCGTAEGICIALNRFNHIIAATVDTPHLSRIVREHNHANVICIPGPYSNKKFSNKILFEIIETFITAEPSREPRHLRRLQELSKLQKSKVNK